MPSLQQKPGFHILYSFVALCLFFGTSNSAHASALLVNTQAFHVIDDTDATANLYVQFGASLGKKLTYDRAGTQYNFDDDLEVVGTASGRWLHAQDRLTSSGSLAVDGVSVYFNGFSNCTALETVNGLLTCGTDDLGGGSLTAGQGITVNGSNVRLNAAHSGTTIEATTLISGAIVQAQNELRSSGTLVVEGNTSLRGVQYSWPTGAASASGKVLKVNPANGQLSWSSDLTGGGASTVVSTANVSDTTTGGTNNVTGLSIPVSASTNYIVRCLVTTGAAAATTGVQLTINGPASPTQVTWTRQSCSSTTAMINASINAFGTEDARTASAGATRCIEPIFVHLRNGVNAGNITFSVDTEIASSAATVYTGSFCDYQTY